MNRAQFASQAKYIVAYLNGTPLSLTVRGTVYGQPTHPNRTFDTGTVGWYANTKLELLPGGKLELDIGGAKLTADWRRGKTNSWGWHFNGKLAVKVGDEHVDCQVGVNVTVVGSKDWAGEPKPENGAVRCQIGFGLYVVGSKEWDMTGVQAKTA